MFMYKIDRSIDIHSYYTDRDMDMDIDIDIDIDVDSCRHINGHSHAFQNAAWHGQTHLPQHPASYSEGQGDGLEPPGAGSRQGVGSTWLARK